MKKEYLSPKEIEEKRQFERYELFLPVHFKIFDPKNKKNITETIEGFTRNFSKEGLLIDFAVSEKIANELKGKYISGGLFLPGQIKSIHFEGEIRWVQQLTPNRYFFGIKITMINDMDRLEVLKFAQKINRRSKIIVSLIITLFVIFTASLMLIFSFNAYIKKLSARQYKIYNELNDRVHILTKKLKEVTSNITKKEENK